MNPCEAYNKQLVLPHTTLFSHSVVSDSLQPHGLRHTRLPCPYHLLELPKLMSIELVMPSNHLVLCSSLLLPPSIFPSLRVFSTPQWVQANSGGTTLLLIHPSELPLSPLRASTLAATCPLCFYDPSSSSSLGFPLYFPMK